MGRVYHRSLAGGIIASARQPFGANLSGPGRGGVRRSSELAPPLLKRPTGLSKGQPEVEGTPDGAAEAHAHGVNLVAPSRRPDNSTHVRENIRGNMRMNHRFWGARLPHCAYAALGAYRWTARVEHPLEARAASHGNARHSRPARIMRFRLAS